MLTNNSMGSIVFPLTAAPFEKWFIRYENYLCHSKVGLSIQLPHITIYIHNCRIQNCISRSHNNFVDFLFIPPIAPNENIRQICVLQYCSKLPLDLCHSKHLLNLLQCVNYYKWLSMYTEICFL